MTRIRLGLSMTSFIGVIYSATGLFSSLHDVGIGAAVASAGIVGWGLCDFIEGNR